VFARIELHNRLNGYAFVIGEFVVIGVVIGGFGVYYAAHGRPLEAAVALGIVTNAAIIVLLSLHPLSFAGRAVKKMMITSTCTTRNLVSTTTPIRHR